VTDLVHDPINILLAADALLFRLLATVGEGLSPGVILVDVSPEGSSDKLRGRLVLTFRKTLHLLEGRRRE